MENEVQVQIISIVAIFLGFFGVPNLVQWLKTKYNVTGVNALYITAGVAVALALLELALTGQLTPENFAASFSKVFTAATLYYKLLLADKPASG